MSCRVARRPAHISISAEACLQALASRGLGDRLSIRGAFGLLHYLDYRPTRYVQVWWAPSTIALEQEQILTAIEDALRPFGDMLTGPARPVISWAVHCIEGSVDRRECSYGRTQETSA